LGAVHGCPQKKRATVAAALIGRRVEEEETGTDETTEGAPRIWTPEGVQVESEDEAEDKPNVVEIDVLADNVRTVEVFLRCQPQVHLGMGIYWQGVSASEVRAACLLLRVPLDERADVLDGVQHMAQVIADIRNREANKKNG
jgi:hypothetical protein